MHEGYEEVLGPLAWIYKDYCEKKSHIAGSRVEGD